jgi:hypothetical protein
MHGQVAAGTSGVAGNAEDERPARMRAVDRTRGRVRGRPGRAVRLSASRLLRRLEPMPSDRAAELEADLARLARAQAPLRRAAGALARRLIVERGWERLGFARLRDYAAERLGLSARSLYDLAHSHDALRALPAIDAAFLRGDISWTKARLLARVATAADEDAWLARAARLTADALAHEVRAVDAGAAGRAPLDADDEDGASHENVRIRCTPRVQGKWYRARQLAWRVAGHPVEPWQCAEMVAAEVLSALPMDADADAGVAMGGAAVCRSPGGIAGDGAGAGSRSPDAERPPDVREGVERAPIGGASTDAKHGSQLAVGAPRVAGDREGGERDSPRASATCDPAGGEHGSPRAPVAGDPAGDERRSPQAPAADHPAEGERRSPRAPAADDPAGGEHGSPRAPAASDPAAGQHSSPRAPAAGENPWRVSGPAGTAGAIMTPARAPSFQRSVVESLVGDLEHAGPFQLDRRLRRAVRLEQRLDAELGARLALVARAHLHGARGYPDLDAYARERLGMAPRKARALLRLERARRVVPAIGVAYGAGRLSWLQAHALLPVLLVPAARRHGEAWIRWALQVSFRRLQDDVAWAVLVHETDPVEFARTGGLPVDARETHGARDPYGAPIRTTAGPSLDPGRDPGDAASGYDEVSAGDGLGAPRRDGSPEEPAHRQIGAQPRISGETTHLFFHAPRDVARLFRAVLCTVRRALERQTGRLPSEGEAFDAMLEHAADAWLPAGSRLRVAQRVFARDGWRCTAPGCSAHRNLHDHHIVFRSAGGSNELDNRTTLCAWHHLRGVHAGVVRCAGAAPAALRFELGLRSDLPPLLAFGPGERLAGAEGLAAPVRTPCRGRM